MLSFCKHLSLHPFLLLPAYLSLSMTSLYTEYMQAMMQGEVEESEETLDYDDEDERNEDDDFSSDTDESPDPSQQKSQSEYEPSSSSARPADPYPGAEDKR